MKGSFYPGTWVQNSAEKDHFPQELSDFINVEKDKPTFPKVWEKLGLNQFFGHKTSILVGLFLLLSFLLPFGVEGAKPTEGPGNSIAKFPGGVLVNAGGFENSYYVGISEIKKGADLNVITSGVKIPFKATSANAIYNIRTSYREGQTLLTIPDCTTPPDQDFGNYEDITYGGSVDYQCITYTGSDAFVGIGDAIGQGISTSPLFSGSAVVMGGNTSGGFVAFKSISTGNFKLVSLVGEFFGHSNGAAPEILDIKGYDNGSEVISAEGFQVIASGSYGSGNSMVTWVREDHDQDGSNSGTLSFGTGWSNIDEVRFYSAE